VRAKNKDLYTPLMTALAFGNHKCVEELIASKEIELETKDIEGNSIYHICARFNNTESLKYLLEKYFTKTTDILYSKNK
jgi:ankyrin repeat protein